MVLNLRAEVEVQRNSFSFKIATLTFKVLETGLPPYLSQQLLTYASTRGLRSSSSKLLQVPRTKLRFGSRSFRVSAPIIWNSIPYSVRSCESLTTFRKHIKTLYFDWHFLDFGALQIYLLTYLLLSEVCFMHLAQRQKKNSVASPILRLVRDVT